MADATARQLTEADLTDFARQLYEWTRALPEVQQGLLHRILARAASAEADDAEGFIIIHALGGPDTLLAGGNVGPLLLRAIGLPGPLGGGSVRFGQITDGTSNT